MEGFWEFAGSFWWLVFPLAGVLGGAASGFREWDERRRKHRLELARIKYGVAGPAPAATKKVGGSDVDRVLAEHDDVQRRWLAYELDVARLIDYPMMSDMREPLTVDFHRAKRHADGLRPATPKGLKDPERFAEYRRAVDELALAFEVLEGEARRRRTSDFSAGEREVLARAKQLIAMAEDRGATREERRLAYRRAMRELEGLVAVPERATEEMERRIAGQLEGGDPRPVPRPEDV